MTLDERNQNETIKMQAKKNVLDHFALLMRVKMTRNLSRIICIQGPCWCQIMDKALKASEVSHSLFAVFFFLC